VGFEYCLPNKPESRYLTMRGALTVNNSDAYTAACLAGLGIIQVPATGIRNHLETGQVVEMLNAYRPCPMPVSIVYPNRRHLPQRVQVFMT